MTSPLLTWVLTTALQNRYYFPPYVDEGKGWMID